MKGWDEFFYTTKMGYINLREDIWDYKLNPLTFFIFNLLVLEQDKLNSKPHSSDYFMLNIKELQKHAVNEVVRIGKYKKAIYSNSWEIMKAIIKLRKLGFVDTMNTDNGIMCRINDEWYKQGVVDFFEIETIY